MASKFLKSVAFVFLTALVLIPQVFAQNQKSERPLERAILEFKAMGYGAKFAELERIATDARKNGTLLEDGQPVLGALYYGVGHGCFCGADSPELLEERVKNLNAWHKAFPKSPTVEILIGELLISRAWLIRGGGYGHTVPREAMARFEAGLVAAESTFRNMSSEAKADPHWYVAMLNIATAQGWSEERYFALFLESIKKHPKYLPIYFNAVPYYLSQWHGSPAKQIWFIEAAALSQPAPFGDVIYARLNWAYSRLDMFEGGYADWARMKVGFEAMLKDFPDAWNTNNYGKFACMAGDHRTVLSLEAQYFKGQSLQAAWLDRPGIYERCVALARQGVKSQP